MKFITYDYNVHPPHHWWVTVHFISLPECHRLHFPSLSSGNFWRVYTCVKRTVILMGIGTGTFMYPGCSAPLVPSCITVLNNIKGLFKFWVSSFRAAIVKQQDSIRRLESSLRSELIENLMCLKIMRRDLCKGGKSLRINDKNRESWETKNYSTIKTKSCGGKEIYSYAAWSSGQ